MRGTSKRRSIGPVAGVGFALALLVGATALGGWPGFLIAIGAAGLFFGAVESVILRIEALARPEASASPPPPPRAADATSVAQHLNRVCFTLGASWLPATATSEREAIRHRRGHTSLA